MPRAAVPFVFAHGLHAPPGARQPRPPAGPDALAARDGGPDPLRTAVARAAAGTRAVVDDAACWSIEAYYARG